MTTVKQFWSTLTRDAGLENARLYDLRRTFATKLLASGVDIRSAMALTGHTTAGILLKVYAQAQEERQREAVEKLFTDA